MGEITWNGDATTTEVEEHRGGGKKRDGQLQEWRRSGHGGGGKKRKCDGLEKEKILVS